MFQFGFGDVKVLNDFLSINDVDYVDCLLEGDSAKLITSTSDTFAEFVFRVHKSANQGDERFRIYKGLLKFITVRDRIGVVIEDGKVLITFYDVDTGVVRYKCSCSQQVVAATVYSTLMELAENLPEAAKVKLGTLSKIEKIANSSTGIVNVDRGVASVLTQEGARVYQKVSEGQTFSVTTKAMSNLKKCNSEVSNYQDFLIASNEKGFTVIVRKSRLQTNEEYQLLKGKHWGAQFTAKADLSDLFRFLSKIKIDIDSIDIDLEEGNCVLSAMRSEFFIPVRLTEVHTTGKLKRLAVPTMVICKLLHPLSSVFEMRVTKTFVQMESGDFTVVW